MIRIDKAVDLGDLFGGQTEFEWAVYLYSDDGRDFDIIGHGHSCNEAVYEARATMRTWRKNEAAAMCPRGCGMPRRECECQMVQS